MATVQLTEITSRECRRYLTEGGDLAFLPVGSVERLGPHLPLGIKCYIVSAIANMMAEKNNGYCLPVIPYSTLCDTCAAPGSVDTDPQVLYDFVYDICRELVANGFRRIVFVSYFRELYYVIAEFFQQENVPLAWVCPDNIPILEGRDRDVRETSLAAACLRLTGKTELLERVLENNRLMFGKYETSPTRLELLSSLRKLGRMSYEFRTGEYPVLPVKEIYVEEAARDLENWVNVKKEAIDALKDYAYYLSRRRADRGMI